MWPSSTRCSQGVVAEVLLPLSVLPACSACADAELDLLAGDSGSPDGGASGSVSLKSDALVKAR
jgi:hypothetical protein